MEAKLNEEIDAVVVTDAPTTKEALKAAGPIHVKIELVETSQPIYRDALNTYTKGPFYCVYTLEGQVEKYPTAHLFRVTESYTARA